ncbi:MAG: small multi-drug export protein [Candidatus Aenigmatarchaeota archaeon]
MVIITTLSPIVELNGSIPLGIALGLDPLFTFLIVVVTNSLLFFVIYFALFFFYENFISKINFFKKYIEKSRRKVKPYVKKYGYLGLTAFIALPTPFTGVYTGSVIAWILGMDWKKSFLAIVIAVVINGLIVLGAVLGIFEFLKFLL